jgi:hypothetical protein
MIYTITTAIIKQSKENVIGLLAKYMLIFKKYNQIIFLM